MNCCHTLLLTNIATVMFWYVHQDILGKDIERLKEP
jgi:hypothetical protein